MEFSFTIFPKAAAFFKPTKCTLYNPPFWQYFELVKLISLYHFNRCPVDFFYCVGKLLPRVPSIDKEIAYGGKVSQMKNDHLLCTISIRNIGTGYMYSMRQSKRIDNNMQFYPGHLFSSIISFFFCGISVFYTLCINNPKCCLVLFQTVVAHYNGPLVKTTFSKKCVNQYFPILTLSGPEPPITNTRRSSRRAAV